MTGGIGCTYTDQCGDKRAELRELRLSKMLCCFQSTSECEGVIDLEGDNILFICTKKSARRSDKWVMHLLFIHMGQTHLSLDLIVNI